MKTLLHRTWEIRLFHWLFFIVILLKIWSGFYITSPHPLWGLGNLYQARMLHATMTPVLAALLTFRLYYSLLTGDWRDVILWRRNDLRQIVPWLRYIFFLRTTAPVPERTYPIGSRLLFTAIFLTMPLFFTTGVVMLNLPYFRWLNIFYGGQGVSRLAHFLVSVFLTLVAVVHVYLTVTGNPGRLKAMIRGESLVCETMPKRSNADESDPPGGAGKSGHV